VPAEGGVDGEEVGAGFGRRREVFGVGREGGRETELRGEEVGGFDGFETGDEGGYGHGESRRVGIGWVLDLEFGGDLFRDEEREREKSVSSMRRDGRERGTSSSLPCFELLLPRSAPFQPIHLRR